MFKAQIIYDLATILNYADEADQDVRMRCRTHMEAVANQLWKGTNGNKPVSIKAMNVALVKAGWLYAEFMEENNSLILAVGVRNPLAGAVL